jgi:acetyl esterase/lipase
MKIRVFLYVAFLLVLNACQSVTTPTQTPTQTPMPSPEPTPTPAFDPAKYGSADMDLTYCSPDDLPQKMDIYYPASGGPWPVLFYVHGGSWMEGDKAEGEGWRGMNDSGYLVVSVNYRMAAEGKFPVMIEDLKCALRFLRAHRAEYNLDPDRIGAIGASAGAHLVALLGTADESAGWDEGEYADQSSRVRAVVCQSGIYDLTVKVPAGIGTPIFYAFGALAGKESPEMLAASPVTYIDSADPPFLILHGTQDGVLPVEQAEIMHTRLTEAGVPSTLVIVENGDHGLQPLPGKEISPSRNEIDQIIFDFLEANLK